MARFSPEKGFAKEAKGRREKGGNAKRGGSGAARPRWRRAKREAKTRSMRRVEGKREGTSRGSRLIVFGQYLTRFALTLAVARAFPLPRLLESKLRYDATRRQPTRIVVGTPWQRTCVKPRFRHLRCRIVAASVPRVDHRPSTRHKSELLRYRSPKPTTCITEPRSRETFLSRSPITVSSVFVL